jgi:catabolite regulation protein CreA
LLSRNSPSFACSSISSNTAYSSISLFNSDMSVVFKSHTIFKLHDQSLWLWTHMSPHSTMCCHSPFKYSTSPLPLSCGWYMQSTTTY